MRVVLAAGHVLDREVNVDSQHEVSGEACEDEKTDLGAASTDGMPASRLFQDIIHVVKCYKTGNCLFCNGRPFVSPTVSPTLSERPFLVRIIFSL